MARGDRLVFDLDAEDVKLFCEESTEQLELLDTALVRLEQDAEPALLQQIFRAAHTLKGSSATIGHVRMARLTHGMETVLDAVRQGSLVPSAAMVDTLLGALDILRDLVAEVQTGVDSGAEIAEIEALLGSFTDAPLSGRAEQSAVAAQDAASPVFAGGTAGFVLRVLIAEDCQLPSIRCYQVLQELDIHGTIAEIAPPREVIESAGADRLLTATLLTVSAPAELEAAIRDVPDVASVTLVPLPATHPDDASPSAGTSESSATPDGETAAAANITPLAAAHARQASQGRSQSVRIDVERLDGLMNLVGELVIDHTRLKRIREQLTHVLKDASLAALTENFEETTAHLGRVTEELQEQIMRSRMLPIRSVMTRLPRLVRDLASQCGKRVELVTRGEDTELDRSVIEEISDPLVHVLRNAIDHGIETPAARRAAGKPETGTVTVTAWNQETYLFLSIRDDGRGVDIPALRRRAVERGLVPPEADAAASEQVALEYLFLAGLSTADTVSDVSGRGVGMDIVRTNVERLHGQVHIRSTPGEGSEFTIQLPLTLATTKALMVGVAGTTFAIPLVSVTEALSGREADISSVGGRPTLRLRNQLFPVVDLGRALGDRSEPERPVAGRFVVAARHGDRQVGFVVDALLGEQDVVVKSLGTLLGNRHGLTGATILGDGTLGLIVDTASLVADFHRPIHQVQAI